MNVRRIGSWYSTTTLFLEVSSALATLEPILGESLQWNVAEGTNVNRGEARSRSRSSSRRLDAGTVDERQTLFPQIEKKKHHDRPDC